MASSAAAVDRRSSAPLNLSSDLLSILRRSSAIFFSSSFIGPLLLTLASLLLFLFRSLILYLAFRCTASRMKHRDVPNYSIAIMIYYQLVITLILAFAFFGYFILYSALHLTALLTVLSSLLNIKPPPTAGSFVATFRHGCRFGDDRLLVFPKMVFLSKQVQHSCALFLLTFLVGDDASLRSLRRMALSPIPSHLLDDVAVQFPMLIGAWAAVEMAATVGGINLAPWVLLFLDPAADEGRNIGVWYVVKRGYYLMSSMYFQAMTIKIMEDVLCGGMRRMDLMTIMAAGDWRGLFVVLVVKSVAEAFFTVVWLVFYVAARSKAAAENGGEAFGVQDLNNCLARLG